MRNNKAFWAALDDLVASSRVVIDRSKGTAHPRFPDLIYPLDYGYLEGTSSPDGREIDAWVGSLPDRKLTAIVATVDTLKRDAEVKLLLGCTSAEASDALRTINSGPMAGTLIERPRT